MWVQLRRGYMLDDCYTSARHSCDDLALGTHGHLQCYLCHMPVLVVNAQVVVQGFFHERRYGPRRVIHQYARRPHEHQRRQQRLPGRPFRRRGKHLISRVYKRCVLLYGRSSTCFWPKTFLMDGAPQRKSYKSLE